MDENLDLKKYYFHSVGDAIRIREALKLELFNLNEEDKKIIDKFTSIFKFKAILSRNELMKKAKIVHKGYATGVASMNDDRHISIAPFNPEVQFGAFDLFISDAIAFIIDNAIEKKLKFLTDRDGNYPEIIGSPGELQVYKKIPLKFFKGVMVASVKYKEEEHRRILENGTEDERAKLKQELALSEYVYDLLESMKVKLSVYSKEGVKIPRIG